MRLRENTPAQEMQVNEIAEQIRPWLAGKEMETTGPRLRAAQLARSARLAAIEASTAAESIGREGFFVSSEPAQQSLAGCAPGLILVVEDDEIQAKIVARYLEKDGHQLRLAHDGEAALAMLQDGPLPQLVLLDVELPGIDGFAVLEQLRAAPETQNIRVIMLTGQADRADLAKGVVLGANGYITKPFQPEQLRQAVRRLWPAS
jgi:CheY-like chemotaxis protein